MTDQPDTKSRAQEFIDRVETNLEIDCNFDSELGDQLGWFMPNTETEIQGETFEAATDFELTPVGIAPLIAEIRINTETADEDKVATLNATAMQIEDGDPEALYEYDLSEDNVSRLLTQLGSIHADVFPNSEY